MAESESEAAEFAGEAPPPRPTTPPIRRGFLWVFLLLCVVTAAVYGVPALIEQTGYAYEKGRARASIEALEKLDGAGAIARASELFRLATQAISPAVVHIQTQTFAKDGSGNRSLGSGVVIDKENGLIVTNHHVIQDADLITVRVGRQTEMEAKLVGDDPRTDLAVIQVKGTLPLAARWGDSDKLEPGEWVLAVGSPLGLERTVSAGIISATARHNLGFGVADAYENYLQSDVAINPGNSGGPLVDPPGLARGRGREPGDRLRDRVVARAAGGRAVGHRRQGRARVPRRGRRADDARSGSPAQGSRGAGGAHPACPAQFARGTGRPEAQRRHHQN